MRLTIVIPALNEEAAVGDTLGRTLAARAAIAAAGVESVDVVLVSDGSSDRTVEIARGFAPDVRVEVFEHNRGYGAAIKHGFDLAVGDLAGFMDADGTCDPEFFAVLVRRLVEEDADISCGSRMGPDSRMPRVRRWGNRLFRAGVNALAGSRLTDVASGMRVLRRDRLRDIYPLPDGLHFTPAMSCRAALDPALKIIETPMPYAERIGRSKLAVLRDGVRFLRIIVEIGVTYRPLRFLGIPGAVLCALACWYGMGLIVVYFAQGRHVPDWMIYRMAGISGFAAAGLSLLLTGLLAERMVELLSGRRRPHNWLVRVLDRAARPPVTLGLGLAFLAASVYADRGAIFQYVTEGHLRVHWSFVMFGLFAVIVAFNLFCFAALDFLLGLFPEQMTRLCRFGRSDPGTKGTSGP